MNNHTKGAKPEHKPFEYVTMSFRVFGMHADMIHRAAALKSGRSTASYMRQLVCDWAASDLSEEAPDYTALTQGPSQIVQAAEAMGMNQAEFAAYAMRALAAEVIERKRKSEPPPAAPGERPSSRSGSHLIDLPGAGAGRRAR